MHSGMAIASAADVMKQLPRRQSGSSCSCDWSSHALVQNKESSMSACATLQRAAAASCACCRVWAIPISESIRLIRSVSVSAGDCVFSSDDAAVMP